jgi:hypothetical protein
MGDTKETFIPVLNSASTERLAHFQCGVPACRGWWSIGDPGLRGIWTCPWCATTQRVPSISETREEQIDALWASKRGRKPMEIDVLTTEMLDDWMKALFLEFEGQPKTFATKLRMVGEAMKRTHGRANPAVIEDRITAAWLVTGTGDTK